MTHAPIMSATTVHYLEANIKPLSIDIPQLQSSKLLHFTRKIKIYLVISWELFEQVAFDFLAKLSIYPKADIVHKGCGFDQSESAYGL